MRNLTTFFLFNKANKAVKLACLAATMAASTAYGAETTILVQFNEYEGDEAYFALYLVDPDGRYQRTLWVSGDEERWYADMPRWWRYYSRNPQELDAVTGASTKAGDRTLVRVEIDDAMLDAGYSIRVETAVEDLENHALDIDHPLSSEQMGNRIPGTGYVRFLRYKW
ncbi:MAG: DUF2271 domain-containing protein [Rhodobacteraceae bacterium]|nr:DUF2271 domain-containing protein [Paracoccaceae bacterium]